MWYAIIVSYYFLLALLLYRRSRRRRIWKLVTKALCSLAFVAVAAIALRQNPDAGQYAVWILIGLGLSVGGDIALVYDERSGMFAGGLCLFLLAHIAYGMVFALFSGAHVWDAFFFILLAGIGIAAQQLAKIDLQRMTAPVFVYLLAISFMAAQAFSLCIDRGPSAFSVLAGLGALLFYISDGILAWDRFKKPSPAAKVCNLLCYYTAQLLLALSVLFFI